MKTFLSSAVLVGLCLAGVAPVSAQQAPRPQGFFIGFGAGWSSLGYSCDGCTGTSRSSGVAVQVRLGKALSPSLLVGADVESWNKTEGGKWAKTAAWTAAAYWYPMPSNGLYLKGGVGLATINGTISGYAISGTGVALTGGLGYDWPISKAIYLTPTASYFYGSIGDVNTGSVTAVRGWKQNVFNVGVNLTFP